MAFLFFFALAFLCFFADSGAQICGEVKIAVKGIINKDIKLGYCGALQNKVAEKAVAEAQEFLNEYAKSQGLDILPLPSGVHELDTPAAAANKSSTVNKLVKDHKKLAEVMREMGKNFVAENKLAVSQHPIYLMTPHALAPNRCQQPRTSSCCTSFCCDGDHIYCGSCGLYNLPCFLLVNNKTKE
uniref:Uncharacterized protein n=1 Tax=Ditylenchus dipsaci TaxID=166011 RepID=A0A915DE31_9BILA